MNQKGSAPVFLLVSVLAIGLVIGAYKLGSNNSKKEGAPINNEIQTKELNNKMLTDTYVIEYPADYYIKTKYGDEFSLVNKKWEGYGIFDASVGIRIYQGDVPRGMKLAEWLDKVSTTNKLIEPREVKSPCKSSKEFLRKENIKTPYGGSDQGLAGDSCLFYGVKDIKAIELPNVKNDSRYPGDLEILEFSSSDNSVEGVDFAEDKHTLIYFGSLSVVEIYKSQNDPYKDNDGSEDTYNILKKTFKFRE